MKLKYGDYFTGGGVATVGARAAGFTPVFGVECDPSNYEQSMRIADCYETNFGRHMIRRSVTDVDPAHLPAVDWFHASPVCKNASVAKADAGEEQIDIDTAKATARYIYHHRPKFVTIENVYFYRTFKAFELLMTCLNDCGYGFEPDVQKAHYNFADYGVPQTRKRLFITAVLGERLPLLPPTHMENPPQRPMLFDVSLPKWRGWYGAVEDLVPTLPTAHYSDQKRPCEHDPLGRPCREHDNCRGHFADWQISKLPKNIKHSVLIHGTNSHLTVNEACEPSGVIVSSLHSKTAVPRAFVVHTQANSDTDGRYGDAPIYSIGATKSPSQAFVMMGGNASSTRPLNGNEPIATLTASIQEKEVYPKAFLLGRGKRSKPQYQSSPADTITSNRNQQGVKAFTHGRVVKLTPRALARLQSMPDTYQLPERPSDACCIIGNGVPSEFVKLVGERFKEMAS